ESGEVVFFFSSRRRHTRSYGDWSSDVCSSDLILIHCLELLIEGLFSTSLGHSYIISLRFSLRLACLSIAEFRRPSMLGLEGLSRSEERRVGKERRSRG